LLDRTHGFVQIALQDHVVVDHGDNAVQWLPGGCGGRGQQLGVSRECDRQCEQQEGNGLLHTVKSLDRLGECVY
jgi:hypothetical protein